MENTSLLKQISSILSVWVLVALVLTLGEPLGSRVPAGISENNKGSISNTGIFTDPAESGWFQLAAGAGEGLVGYIIHKNLKNSADLVPPEAQRWAEIEKAKQHARELPTTVAERQNLINVAQERVSKLHEIRSVTNGKAANATLADLRLAEQELQAALRSKVVTATERTRALKVAEKAWSDGVKNGFQTEAVAALKRKGWIRWMKRTGEFMLFADVASRVYVWTRHNADPYVSPIGTVVKYYSYDKIKSLLNKNKTDDGVDASIPVNNGRGGSEASYLESFEEEHQLIDASGAPHLEFESDEN